MKSSKNILALCAALLITASLFSQSYFDCIDALEVCNQDELVFEMDSGAGTVTEDPGDFCGVTLINNPTFLDENTIWLRYQFSTAGDFHFTIHPIWDSLDIDFMVFTTATGSCESLEPARCMFSGITVNSPDNEPCLGATGLAPGSTDTAEDGGCMDGSDNFLAPMEVQEGEAIYLAVKAFSGTNEYTIEHGGSATISCQTVSTSNQYNSGSFILAPNPATEVLSFTSPKGISPTHLELLNTHGQIVLQQRLNDQTDIDVSGLPGGIYFARVWQQHRLLGTQKILLQ
jgi:hypothetical protein